MSADDQIAQLATAVRLIWKQKQRSFGNTIWKPMALFHSAALTHFCCWSMVKPQENCLDTTWRRTDRCRIMNIWSWTRWLRRTAMLRLQRKRICHTSCISARLASGNRSTSWRPIRMNAILCFILRKNFLQKRAWWRLWDLRSSKQCVHWLCSWTPELPNTIDEWLKKPVISRCSAIFYPRIF